jgi:hypothetical protein
VSRGKTLRKKETTMSEKKEWQRHLDAVLTAIDQSTAEDKLSRREALGWLNILTEAVDERREALGEEVDAEEGEPEGEFDDELLEAFEEDEDD